MDDTKRKEAFIKLLKNNNGNLSDLDVSNLNLESITIDCYFNTIGYIKNVNFENSKITIDLDSIYIYNSNLKGTNVLFNENSYIKLYNVILDEETISKLNDLLEFSRQNIEEIIDILTVSNNKGINITSKDFCKLLSSYFQNNSVPLFMTNEDIVNFDNFTQKVLKINSSFKTIYDNVKDQLNYAEKIRFFTRLTLEGKTFKNITITQEIMNLFDNITLENCSFENVVFDCDISENLMTNNSRIHLKKVKNITIPNLKFSDWDKISHSRFQSSPITFKKNLYIELGRKCNASCSFCRNECMEKVPYNYPNIKGNLYKIIDNIDSVVIGGGEPTLMEKDLIDLLDSYNYYRYRGKFFVFSNGTKTQKINDKIGSSMRPSYYISRHSYDEEVNASILGIKPSKVMTNDELENFCRNANVNLSCTCINGGMDTPEKIFRYISEFINYSKNIIFCNLMKDASINLEDKSSNSLIIDDKVFDEVIDFLQKQGFTYNYSIVSTGGYELIVLKHPNFKRSITFKKYITIEELEDKWPTAIKRTFDLSMAPDGSIYENWSETGQKVKTL